MHSIIDQQFASLTPHGLVGWRMAGNGGFSFEDGVLESRGGPGILWYRPTLVDDFILRCAWRTRCRHDHSGIFLRIPPLEDDIAPAIDQGFEVEIDDRGFNPQTGHEDSVLHLSGAIHGLSPASAAASRPPGEWNLFQITARGRVIDVRLNGLAVNRFEVAMRRAQGHIGLQTHHEGSCVQFRDLSLQPLHS